MNPKKNNRDRRKRPAIKQFTHRQVWVEFKTKSQAGVEYTHYKPTLVAVK